MRVYGAIGGRDAGSQRFPDEVEGVQLYGFHKLRERERARVCVCERKSVCVCEREKVCVRVCEREKVCVRVCVCV